MVFKVLCSEKKTLLIGFLIRDFKEGVDMRISRRGMYQTVEIEDIKFVK